MAHPTGYSQSPEQIAGDKFRFDKRYGRKATDANHEQEAMDHLARDRQAYLKAGGRAALLHKMPGAGEHLSTADFLAAQQQIHDLHHTLDPDGAKAYYAPKQGPGQSGATVDAEDGYATPAARQRITPSSGSAQVPRWIADHAGSAAERAMAASSPSMGARGTQVDIVAKQNSPGMRPGAEAIIRPNTQPSTGPRSIGRILSKAEGDAFIGANGKALGPADATDLSKIALTGQTAQTPYGTATSRRLTEGEAHPPSIGAFDPKRDYPLASSPSVQPGSGDTPTGLNPVSITPRLTLPPAGSPARIARQSGLKESMKSGDFSGTPSVVPTPGITAERRTALRAANPRGVPLSNPPQVAPAVKAPDPVVNAPASPAPTPTAAISPQTGIPLSKMSTSAIATRTAPDETEEQRLKRLGGTTRPARNSWMTA